MKVHISHNGIYIYIYIYIYKITLIEHIRAEIMIFILYRFLHCTYMIKQHISSYTSKVLRIYLIIGTLQKIGIFRIFTTSKTQENIIHNTLDSHMIHPHPLPYLHQHLCNCGVATFT